MSARIARDVIVVGGGISGLACAWGLQQRGLDVIVLEAEKRAGGTIGTTRSGEYLFESGPNSTLDTTPLLRRLLDEAGIAHERVDASTAARNRYVVRDGRLLALPLAPSALLSTALFSRRAKLRLFAELLVARGPSQGDESVAAFVRRRLGGEFLDYAVDPFVAGVYAGDPELLSVRAAFPRLHELEQKHGSLLAGQLLGARARARDPEQSKRTATMFAFRDGMQTLTDALARRLAHVELTCEVVGIACGNGRQRVTVRTHGASREFESRAVVLAVPAYVAAGLVASFAPGAGEALAAIPYSPIAVVVSGYRSGALAHPLDGFGVLVPRRERRNMLGAIFSSTLFAHRAPRDHALLTTFVGGARQPHLAGLDDDALAALVHAEHSILLGARAPADFVRVKRWPRAIPQYTLGHLGRIAAIGEAERSMPGLFFCANYRGGVSVGDCVKSAAHTAEDVAALLRTT